MEEKKLTTIIVLRNDKSTSWSTSSVVLKEGEVGISYLVDDNGNKTGGVVLKVGNGVDTWVDLPTVIDTELTNRFDTDIETIKNTIGEVADDKTVVTLIAEALQAAKDYADANDADTIYDDTDLQNRVKAIEDDYLKATDKTEITDRVTTIENTYLKLADKYDDTAITNRVATLEGTVGGAEGGLVKDVADNTVAIGANATAIEANTTAIAAEKERAEAAEAQVLADSKAHTDTELAGIVVSIEKEDGVEHIVLKNKSGDKITSVSASKFVQDSFLNNVEYNTNTRKITFTWLMGDGTDKTDEVDISDLVDTYTNGFGLTLSNNEFCVDTTVIATLEALNEVSEIADAAQTAQEVSDAIDAKIASENLAQYAIKVDMETELNKKANTVDVVSNDAFNTFKGENTQAIETAKEDALAEVEATYLTKEAFGTFQEGNTGAINGVNEALTTHIGDKENPHEVTKAQVGLGNVDNTADADKPVSTAQAEAIADAKKAGTDASAALGAYKTEIAALMATKADKATTIAGYGITDAYTKTEVDSSITDAIAAMVHPKASSEVTVAEDGTLGIGAIDVSKLIQTGILIIDGGNATA
jgi:hypothetical protein